MSQDTPPRSPLARYIDLYREHCGTDPMLNNQECEVINRLAEWVRSETVTNNAEGQTKSVTQGVIQKVACSDGNSDPSAPAFSSDKQETPRTDAHLSHLNLPDGYKVGLPMETVDLLRQLERELAAMRDLAYSGAFTDSEIPYRDLARMYLAERNAAHAARSARGHITELPAEFAALAEFYQVDDMPALIRIQAEHVERLQKKLPPLRGPESDPQNYRQG